MRRFSPCLAVISFLILAACSGQDVKDTLGLDRSAPDEFRVVSRPPLSIPPDFELRPPMPNESELPSLPPDRLAHSLITGEAPPSVSGTAMPTAATAVKPVEAAPVESTGDTQLLSNMGASKADPGIREKILQDKTQDAKEPAAWYNLKKKKAEEELNPVTESQRLKKDNIPTNKPAPDDAPAQPATADQPAQ